MSRRLPKSMIRAEGPVLAVDFADPALNGDPFAQLHRIRELGDVVFNPVTGWWMASSYETVSRVLGDDVLFEPYAALMTGMFGGRVCEIMDNPEHDQVTGLMHPHLGTAAVMERSASIQRLAEQLLDPLVEALRRGEVVDLIPGFIDTFPSLVMAQILGVDLEDYQHFHAWSSGIAGILEGMSDQTERGRALRRLGADSMAALSAYCGAQLDERRTHGSKDDLISTMALSPVAAELLAEEDRRATIVQFIHAGQTTVAAWMGATIVALARHREQRLAVAADRALVPQALDEVLRWQSPIFSNWRRVRDVDVAFRSATLVQGDMVVLLHAAANRDPERWGEPDRFDIFRTPQAHVGWGGGAHTCVAPRLAQIETRIWLEAILDRIPDFELAGEPLDYGSNCTVRAPVALPVRLVGA